MTTDQQPTARACVAFGANLGDREGAIRAAIAALDAADGVTVRAVSTLHETEAVTLPGAPAQPAYLNAAAVLETTLDPGSLLRLLLETESALGRDRASATRWAARKIDLDLLLYDDRVIDRPGLRVPHPRLHERRFVLAPLAEIAPDLTHPELGRTVRELLASLETGAHRRGGSLATLACAIGLVLGAPALAQSPAPEQAAARAEQIAPGEALDRMQAAYLAGPIGEHLDIVARSSGQVRQNRLTLRLAPEAARIDFDSMVVEATGAGLAIVHERSGRARFTASAPGEDRLDLLARVAPPLPLPQMAIAMEGSGATAIAPLCRDLRWFSATPMEGLLLVEGVGPECSASLALDASSWRLVTATLRGRSPSGPISVELRAERFDPGDPAAWMLDRASLTPVDTLADLAPREGDVRVGDAAPDVLLLTRDAAPWRLTDALQADAAPVALVIVRDDATEVRTIIDAVAVAASSGATELRLVIGVVLPEAGVAPLERLAALAERWDADLLWTVSADTTLGRFAPDAVGAFVVVDAEGRVRLLEPIENRAIDAASMARRIVESLGSG